MLMELEDTGPFGALKMTSLAAKVAALTAVLNNTSTLSTPLLTTPAGVCERARKDGRPAE
jgi:hypothetical protein